MEKICEHTNAAREYALLGVRSVIRAAAEASFEIGRRHKNAKALANDIENCRVSLTEALDTLARAQALCEFAELRG